MKTGEIRRENPYFDEYQVNGAKLFECVHPPKNSKDWTRALKSIYPDFGGNLDIAGRLMDQFKTGGTSSLQAWKKEGLPNFVAPPIALSDSLEGVQYNPNLNLLIVGKSYLEHASTIDIKSTMSIKGRGSVIFVGTMERFFHLLGTQEVDHVGYKTKHPNIPVIPNSALQGLSSAEYDALDVEFHALHQQRKEAVKLKYPQETFQCLMDRIHAASLIRNPSSNAPSLAEGKPR